LKPLPERLNYRLERQNARFSKDEELSGGPVSSTAQSSFIDPEVDELVDLAYRFESASQLEVDPSFARQLEQRVLMHNSAWRLMQFRHRRLFPHLGGRRPFFGVALSFCILLFLLGTGVLLVSAQVSNPDNPLYVMKRLEQHVQVSLINSSENQTEMDLQSARYRLKSLTKLVNSAEAYQEALAELDKQISTASKAINTFPAGSSRDRLVSELAALVADARSALRLLLPKLALPERLVTTSELGHLGDNVPRLNSVTFVLPAHPNGHATISISGQGIQPGAQLLVNGQLVFVQGYFQNGLYIFIEDWEGNLHPQSAGILNPDGTAALTSTIALKTSDEHGNGKSKSGVNGNGNGGGKPNGSPTSHH
jgi:hypothetical protein